MTPSLFDLPLRTGEAAALASIVLEHAEGKPLTDELRWRLASRAAALKLASIVPYFGSLEKDPVHPSTFYLAVDGLEAQPLLMHLAPATAPSSALFPKAILIGRMQAAGAKRREIVVNASPFSPADASRVRAFVEDVNRAFLPRPQGSRTAICVSGAWVDNNLPVVFEEFRSIFKSKSANLASLRLTDAPLESAMWAAIRAGWREGYTLAGATRFALDAVPEGSLETRVKAHEEEWDRIRAAKAKLKHLRAFDFELNLCEPGAILAPEQLSAGLQLWKAGGRPTPLLSATAESAATWEELAGVARQFQTILSIDVGDGQDADLIERAGRITNGRVDCKIAPEGPGRIVEAARMLLG